MSCATLIYSFRLRLGVECRKFCLTREGEEAKEEAKKETENKS